MWLGLMGYAVTAAAIILIPGLLVGFAAGFTFTRALPLAPIVGLAVVGISAAAADLIYEDWGYLPVIVGTAIAVAVSWLVSVLPSRVRGRTRTLTPYKPHQQAVVVATVLGAIALLAYDAIRIIGKPTSFSQTFDNIFHLNVVRWILEYGNGSSFRMTMTDATGGSQFYPMVWHDVVSATLSTMGSTDVVGATNAMIIVTMCLVWPLSVIALIQVLSRRLSAVVSAVILAASFGAFPYLLVGYGVLYPNLLGYAVAPAAIAVLAGLWGFDPRGIYLPTHLFFLGACAAATCLTHPNVTVTVFAVIGSCMGLAKLIDVVTTSIQARRLERVGILTIAAVIVYWGLSLAVYLRIRPDLVWLADKSSIRALWEGATFSPQGVPISPVLGVLGVIGFVVALTRARWWWLAVAHAIVMILWVAAASLDHMGLRELVVAVWYGDPFRLASLLPLTGIGLCAIACIWIEGRIHALINRNRPARAKTSPWIAITSLVCLAGLCAATQAVPAKAQIIDQTHSHYVLDENSPLVTSDEYAMILQVPSQIEPGDVVAVNPWNGSSLLYALTGVHTTSVHTIGTLSANEEIMNAELDQAVVDPQVCPALNDLDVRWVLDFGQTDQINESDNHYPGWDDLAVAPGFTPVVSRGSLVLYRVDACE